ncbi:MAG: ABC transporter ATP-binding protein [Actinomycetota bacterium]|nr:ABC transporter ATP-binding protein [Actinomycetota bacterium]
MTETTTSTPTNGSVVAPAGRLLTVEHLVKTFALRGRLLAGSSGTVQAVSDVSFNVDRNETLSLVGESGCGKSTTARCVLGILEPDSGSIVFDGVELTTLPPGELRRARRRFQMVFQDPQASLNPRMTVAELLAEPLQVHGIHRGSERSRVAELLELVQLPDDAGGRYPHQFSGGQRQRIGVARALAVSPDLLVLDEPVSALDVSIQAEIIRLLERLRAELDLGFLFIAHDLSVVRHISDRVAVMYLGRIVETGTATEVYEASAHPYTQALLSAAPIPDPLVERDRQRIVLVGEAPTQTSPPSGCRFRTRCWKATDRCADEVPPLTDPGIGHAVACHYPEPINIVAQQAMATPTSP